MVVATNECFMQIRLPQVNSGVKLFQFHDKKGTTVPHPFHRLKAPLEYAPAVEKVAFKGLKDGIVEGPLVLSLLHSLRADMCRGSFNRK